MRRIINLFFVLLAIAAVIYGLMARYSNYKATKESHAMELLKNQSEKNSLIIDLSKEAEAAPY
ncbi:hypothetical protein AWW67_16705 [Roseivirga seohaensis]|uniref:Uncharacterized protein n=1 Tax=Roseivirga seohaensis TaxID=1914963 RepID=A0A150Y346_9BACT|nr:hypothetical protein [Roseivirga seohaensis]KYG85348.1 hypothetical protein AWW67_16705 [Roseivirga seohaensis]